MNYGDVEDRTQDNQAAERYLALRDEYHVFEERLQRALEHKESFSEKVLAKVTGEYRSKLEQVARETSVLEAQLRAELEELDKQLAEAQPAKEHFRELLEELELRHLTGEITTREYTARRSELESQVPASGLSIETLERNVQFYQQILGELPSGSSRGPAAHPHGVTAAQAPLVRHEDWPAADEEVEGYSSAPEPMGSAPDELSSYEDAQLLEQDEELPPQSEQLEEQGYYGDDDGAEDVQYGDAVAYEPDPSYAEPEAADEEDEYFDPRTAIAELDAEDGYFAAAGEDELEAEAPYGTGAETELQSEEDFFENEFDSVEPSAATDDWAELETPSSRAGYAGEEPDHEELVEPAPYAEHAAYDEGDEIDIPEELLLDEDDYLQPVAEEDSAALLQATGRLLENEAFEDELDEYGELADGSRPLQPAVVLHEGTGNEKIYYMTDNLLTIGRGPDNDIQLATDTSVSRHHSRILFEDDEYWIADLGSSNGTIVNGARVSKTVLTGDDEISIGQTVLKFTFR
jgi:hypothetical protein